MAEQSDLHRVVVIDDDPDVCALLEVLFEVDARFDLVGIAEDGRAGVDLVDQLEPDAVILDLDLPEIDGLEAIARIHAHKPAVHIVVFSAFPDPFTLLDVLRCGADSYLDKATAWAELLPTVAGLCAKRLTQG